ncbi:MAG: hypothetical protein H6993_08015 [Pseudomonadales bacterium]|nr:hypothetical protein [Pseudomonadales bacterium]MCP5183894.1 hypothetical protein [Pseudomonadales bacterium]
MHVNVDYTWRHQINASLGWLDTRGRRDATLYSAGPVEGYAGGRPDSRAFTAQLEVMPWGKADSFASPLANARLGVQYTKYDNFNGRSRNYDGDNRDAKDNNTLFFYVWLAI